MPRPAMTAPRPGALAWGRSWRRANISPSSSWPRNATIAWAWPRRKARYASLTSYASALPAHATLLRLGFGTGRLDSKTVNYAQPKPLESTSRLLVDGVWPLGWVELQILTAAGKPFTPRTN